MIFEGLNNNNDMGEEVYFSKQTFISEVEAIDITLKLIELIQTLHSLNIIHTNFNPSEIYLKEKSLDKMFFMNLYYCSWETLNTLGIFLQEDGDNLSLYNMDVRNKFYLSPE